MCLGLGVGGAHPSASVMLLRAPPRRGGAETDAPIDAPADSPTDAPADLQPEMAEDEYVASGEHVADERNDEDDSAALDAANSPLSHGWFPEHLSSPNPKVGAQVGANPMRANLFATPTGWGNNAMCMQFRPGVHEARPDKDGECLREVPGAVLPISDFVNEALHGGESLPAVGDEADGGARRRWAGEASAACEIDRVTICLAFHQRGFRGLEAGATLHQRIVALLQAIVGAVVMTVASTNLTPRLRDQLEYVGGAEGEAEKLDQPGQRALLWSGSTGHSQSLVVASPTPGYKARLRAELGSGNRGSNFIGPARAGEALATTPAAMSLSVVASAIISAAGLNGDPTANGLGAVEAARSLLVFSYLAYGEQQPIEDFLGGGGLAEMAPRRPTEVRGRCQAGPEEVVGVGAAVGWLRSVTNIDLTWAIPTSGGIAVFRPYLEQILAGHAGVFFTNLDKDGDGAGMKTAGLRRVGLGVEPRYLADFGVEKAIYYASWKHTAWAFGLWCRLNPKKIRQVRRRCDKMVMFLRALKAGEMDHIKQFFRMEFVIGGDRSAADIRRLSEQIGSRLGGMFDGGVKVIPISSLIENLEREVEGLVESLKTGGGPACCPTPSQQAALARCNSCAGQAGGFTGAGLKGFARVDGHLQIGDVHPAGGHRRRAWGVEPKNMRSGG